MVLCKTKRTESLVQYRQRKLATTNKERNWTHEWIQGPKSQCRPGGKREAARGEAADADRVAEALDVNPVVRDGAKSLIPPSW